MLLVESLFFVVCLVFLLLFMNCGRQMMSMMTELFKRFQLQFGISVFYFWYKCQILSAFLSFAPKIKRWRTLLVQMEQMLFIVSISFFFNEKK